MSAPATRARISTASIATRRCVREALRDPSVPCDTADVDGAFYFFTRVRTTLDSMTVAERLIREHRVAAMPGSAFGARAAVTSALVRRT